MSKKTIMAAIIIAGLLLSLVGTQFVEVACANPVRLVWVPKSPDTSLPQITVESPSQNKTYNSIEIMLNLTVNMPESWFNNDPTGSAPSGHYCNGKILSAQIKVDNNLVQNITVNNDSYLPYNSEFLLNKSLTLTANLIVPEGKHVLIVHVMGESYYNPQSDLTVLTYPISTDSSPVSFNVDTSYPNPSPISSSSPSPSATPNPNPSYPHVTAPLTAFPTPITSPTAPEFPITALAITLLAITILVGAIFRTRKREP